MYYAANAIISSASFVGLCNLALRLFGDTAKGVLIEVGSDSTILCNNGVNGRPGAVTGGYFHADARAAN